MKDPPAIWMELLHQNAEQLADLLKNGRTDRELRKRARALLQRAFLVESEHGPENKALTVEVIRFIVFELDTLINVIAGRMKPLPQTRLEVFIASRYNHQAIKLWGGTGWKKLVRWLEDTEEMYGRMLSRIDWLVARSEQAAAQMGGVRASETKPDDSVTPRENFELVRKAERKKRRR